MEKIIIPESVSPTMSRVPALALVPMLLAGCLVQTSGGPAAEESLVVDANRPAPSFGDVITGPAVGPDLNATTAAAPRLVEGEWWRIRFVSSFMSEDTTYVRVVANATAKGYIFGMPHEGWYKEAIAYHAPAFGDVALNLSYATHNEIFEPVRFPLKAGDTWKTRFAASSFTATVESVDKHRAVIKLAPPPRDPNPAYVVTDQLGATGADPTMTLTYDAQQHEVVRMENFFAVWEVVEHGYDYEGWVTVPRGEHTAIDYGIFPGDEEQVTKSTRTVRVDGGFNRMTMMHLVVAITPGSYRIVSVTPDKKEFRTESTGAKQFVVKFHEATNPDGVWNQEDFIGGFGGTYTMGIAYHQYDIHLPDGHRRSDHSHAVIR